MFAVCCHRESRDQEGGYCHWSVLSHPMNRFDSWKLERWQGRPCTSVHVDTDHRVRYRSRCICSSRICCCICTMKSVGNTSHSQVSRGPHRVQWFVQRSRRSWCMFDRTLAVSPWPNSTDGMTASYRLEQIFGVVHSSLRKQDQAVVRARQSCVQRIQTIFIFGGEDAAEGCLGTALIWLGTVVANTGCCSVGQFLGTVGCIEIWTKFLG